VLSLLQKSRHQGTTRGINRDKEEFVGATVCTAITCVWVTFAQAPVVNIDSHRHGNLTSAQSYIVQEYQKLDAASTTAMTILVVTRRGPKTSLPRPTHRTSCKRCQFEPPVALSGSQTNKQARFGNKQNKQLRWTLHPIVRPYPARFKRRSLHTPNRCASVNNCEVAFARINTPIDSQFSTQPRLESQPRTRSRPAKHLPAA
jgi:hypothetical protein